MIVAAAVEGLDVDGVGRADGRLQLGAAGNALGHGSHLRMMGRVNRIVVKTPGVSSRFARDGAAPWTGAQWYAMDSNRMVSNPFHCECIP